jgi:hypothetical protein
VGGNSMIEGGDAAKCARGAGTLSCGCPRVRLLRAPSPRPFASPAHVPDHDVRCCGCVHQRGGAQGAREPQGPLPCAPRPVEARH